MSKGYELGQDMRKFSVHTRDMAVARSSALSKGFWYGALLAIVGLAGFVAKINPGKPIGSTSSSSTSSSSSRSLNGGYNVTAPTLSAPPSSPVSPQQSLSNNPAPVQSSGPAVSATGAS